MALQSPNFSERFVREQIAKVPYWWHTIEVAPGIFTPGEDCPAERIELLKLPDSMEGMRVLDIGAYSGYFTFECERRGAQVVATDIMAPNVSGFSVAAELLGSQAQHHQRSIYELDRNELGRFDLVLCLGVLYHLRHPLLGLDRIHDVCAGLLVLESQVCDSCFVVGGDPPAVQALGSISPVLEDNPIAQFYPSSELNADPSNWWSPNVKCLAGMLESSGFSATLVAKGGARATFHGRTKERSALVQAEAASEAINVASLRRRIEELTTELAEERLRGPWR